MMMRIVPAILLFAAAACAEDWPGWRGPTGMGQSTEKDLPIIWGGKENRNILWKKPLYAGTDRIRYDQNQSSPIVKDDRVFVTLSYWPPGAMPEKEFPEHHLICFRAADGEQLWDTKVPPGPWRLTDLRGGYTAPTPAADGERVYVLFGSSVAAALDRDGKIVWRKEITPHSFDVAIGVSPVLFNDTVLLAWDQTNKTSRLIALDKKTGESKWEKKRPAADWAHSTPTLVSVNGQNQLLMAGALALEGVDPANGDTIWSCSTGDAKTRIGDTLSPTFANGIVYVDSGRGGPGIAVDPTGKGDVTKTLLKWKIAKVPDGSIGSPVVGGDYIFRMQSPEMLNCYQLADGKSVFAERLTGASPVPSPVATADGRIYIASGGKSYVIKAGPKLNVLGMNDLGDPSHASPAVAGGRLYIKGGKNLYCIGTK
jgi:outer membrane protein assembly factor BamB